MAESPSTLWRSRRAASRSFRPLAWRTHSFVSELDIRHRKSPIVREGEPRLKGGPRPGDRFPDGKLKSDTGAVYLSEVLAAPSMHVMLCGHTHHWDAVACAGIEAYGRGLVHIHYLAGEPAPRTLVDDTGAILKRLAVRDASTVSDPPGGPGIGAACVRERARGTETVSVVVAPVRHRATPPTYLTVRDNVTDRRSP
jgi:hypothetical protein